MKVKVSICIPIFNGEKYLLECLSSIKNQTLKDFEVIISDDNSSDSSLEIVNEFLSDNSWIKSNVIINEKKGIGANWNNCLYNTKGELIKFLFQDDVLEVNCLEEMVNFLDENLNIPMVSSKRNLIVSQNNISSDVEEWIKTYSDLQRGFKKNGEVLILNRSLFSRSDFLEVPKNKIGEPSTVMFRKELTKIIGFFRTDLYQSLDYEYWYRILRHFDIAILDKYLVKFRLHPQQATIQNRNRKIQDSQVYEKIIFFNYFFIINSSLRKRLFFKITLLGKIISRFYALVWQRKKSV